MLLHGIRNKLLKILTQVLLNRVQLIEQVLEQGGFEDIFCLFYIFIFAYKYMAILKLFDNH
jgi:hypothetical protein